MTHNSDMDFVAQLRGMAASTPDIAVPGVANVVRAGRSRVARRRSIYSGAFGLALLASAGLATMPHVGVVGNQPMPIAAVSHQESIAPMDMRVGMAPMAGSVEEPAATSIGESALDQPILDDPVVLDGSPVVEAAADPARVGLSPLATGLGIAGTAALGTAAGLAIRSKRLQPVPVRIQTD